MEEDMKPTLRPFRGRALGNVFAEFIHVPKTAGKNVIETLQKYQKGVKSYHFPPDFKDFDDSKVYYTLIRDPFERLLSEWFHYGLMMSSNETRESSIIKTMYKDAFNYSSPIAFFKDPRTGNAHLKMLLGHSRYANVQLSEADVDIVMNRILSRTLRPIMFESFAHAFEQMTTKDQFTEHMKSTFGDRYGPVAKKLVRENKFVVEAFNKNNTLDVLLMQRIKAEAIPHMILNTNDLFAGVPRPFQ